MSSLYSDMIVNRPAWDWLTLTTYDLELYKRVRAWLHSLPLGTEWASSKHLQYVGDRTDSLFIGSARQGDTSHYLVICSGSLCGNIGCELLSMGEWNVTRYDLQVTVVKPVDYDAIKTATELRGAKWSGSGRAPKVGIYSMDDSGNDTIYIGSSGSDRRFRIYVKDGGYVRHEFVRKGWGKGGLDIRAACWEYLLSYGRIPYLYHVFPFYRMKQGVENIVENTEIAEGVRVEVKEPENKRKWMEMVAGVMVREAQEGNHEWFEDFFRGMVDKVLREL